MTTSPGGEDQFLAWLRQQPGTDLLGNDAAELGELSSLVATVDSQIAGTHFDLDLDPYIVGRRLFRVNASDLAAMGARPAYALLALSAPIDFDRKRLLSGLLEEIIAAKAQLAGGDLARCPVTVASLTLLGTVNPASRPLARNRAQPGQVLWVGGSLGDSALGLACLQAGARASTRWPPNGREEDRGHAALDIEIGELQSKDLPPRPDLAAAISSAITRHLLPRPQLDLGEWLVDQSGGAALDLSDGLARDLPRLCRESSVGAVVDLESIPTSANFSQVAAHLDLAPNNLKFCGGEDYVLLFSLDKAVEPPVKYGCTAIGEITETPDLVLRDAGSQRPWPTGGWDHLAD